MSDLTSGPARLPVSGGADRAPSRIAGRYELGEVIGVGAPAWVYRANDRETGRNVAVKLYPTGFGGPAPARLQQEMGELSDLHHPHLVELLAAGDEAGRAYLVMELVEARTLAQRVLDGPMAALEVARLGADLGYALAYLHSRGIVHRTVKPANVFLGARPMLTDFAIAALVDRVGVPGTGSLIGTPAYLAPEQVAGAGIGMPSDVYALGLVLLEALTGRREFEGDGLETAAARLSRRPTIPADVPALTDLLHAMTAMDPAVRPAAGVVSESLRAAVPKLEGFESARRTPDAGEPRRRISSLERLEGLDALESSGTRRIPGRFRFPVPGDEVAVDEPSGFEPSGVGADVDEPESAATGDVEPESATADVEERKSPAAAGDLSKPGATETVSASAPPAAGAEAGSAAGASSAGTGAPAASADEEAPAAHDDAGDRDAWATGDDVGRRDTPVTADEAGRPEVKGHRARRPRVAAAIGDSGTKVLRIPLVPGGLPLPQHSPSSHRNRDAGRRRLLAGALGLTALAAATVGVLASQGPQDEGAPVPADSAPVDTPADRSSPVPPVAPAPIVAAPNPGAPPPAGNGGGSGGGSQGSKKKGSKHGKKH